MNYAADLLANAGLNFTPSKDAKDTETLIPYGLPVFMLPYGHFYQPRAKTLTWMQSSASQVRPLP